MLRLGDTMNIRNVTTDDYERLSDVVNEWGARTNIFQIVPRLFFEHFQPTSFVIELHGETIGLVIGFISQTDDKQAYVHFIGINPNFRQQGIGRQLYKHFFKTVRNKGCNEILCITTPLNRTSIAFHEALGFQASKMKDYNGPGEDRITFSCLLNDEMSLS